IQAIIHDDPSSNYPVIYFAAGGSDFVTAYRFTPGSNGLAAPLWHTDTSGSSQAITWYQGALIVGGHFDWTENDTTSPPTNQCGSNQAPNTKCYFSPKPVAMDSGSGHVLLTGAS